MAGGSRHFAGPRGPSGAVIGSLMSPRFGSPLAGVPRSCRYEPRMGAPPDFE